MAVAEDLKKSLNGLAYFKKEFKGNFYNLLKTLGNNPSGFSSAMDTYLRGIDTALETIIVPMNTFISQISQAQTGTTGVVPVKTSSDNQIETFIKFANYLDEQGAHVLADQVTDLARMFGYAEPYMSKEPIQPAVEGSLSTRYCPDHVGVPTIRLTDNVVQCVIDGKVYDYSSGYVNYKGQRVPGSSISEQTPAQSNSEIPMRTYEPTANILNRDS
jgi:hypothetical protein